MAYQALCTVPLVLSSGLPPLCPGDAWFVVEVSTFSWDQLDSVSLAARFLNGFEVAIPVFAAIYGVRLLWALLRSA